MARDRRRDLGWTQAELASRIGVGREWMIGFEKGKPTAEWGIVMRALRELGFVVDLHARKETTTHSDDLLEQILARSTMDKGKA